MSTFSLTINTENAAFDDDAGAELARILRDLAGRLELGPGPQNDGRLRDGNGNTVGAWSVA